MKNEESLDFDWERVKSFSEPEIVTERRGFLIGVWKLLKCTEFEQSRSLGLLALVLSFEKKYYDGRLLKLSFQTPREGRSRRSIMDRPD